MRYVFRMARPGKRRSPRKTGKMTVAGDILRLPRVPRPLRAVLFALIVVLIAPYLIVPFYAFGQPVSTAMLWRSMNGERVVRSWVPLSYVDPDLVRAVVVAEDGRFCEHSGMDFAQIQDAIQDAESLEDVRGGSTITQQVAKNLFLWQGRSWLRKALEAPLALWIDLVLSKRRILEIYLNVAEWGPNGEFGVEAGAERAFGATARRLSQTQAGLLAAMLPNPRVRDAKRPGPGLRRLARLYVVRASRAPSAVTACLRGH
jgi:monofunctional biosynthetic peptidoglycan transglycosylase